MQLIFFILACFGATLILTYGRIFDYIRPRYHFFHCPMCIGFWVGACFGFFGIGIAVSFKLFMWACLASGTSYALCTIFDDTGIKVHINT